MTTTRYLIARIGLAFGIQRRQRRMGDAASESHLLREAEQILGERVWENVEEVEELGIEYWNLRRLSTDRERLRKKLTELEAVLTNAHDQRTLIVGEKSEELERLEEKRSALTSELETLVHQRDEIINKAREVRRGYDGLKTKLEVLNEESQEDAGVLEKTQTRMTELRAKFDMLKGDRDGVAREIEARDKELDAIDEKLVIERKRHRTEASSAFLQIGDANRASSECRAELGLIETRMQQLFGEIGRHVSRHAAVSPECRAASRTCRPMIEVMAQLRKSINLNHQLAGN